MPECASPYTETEMSNFRCGLVIFMLGIDGKLARYLFK